VGDATTLELWNDATNNSNGDNFITYAFHSVDGYSKVGSYTGNGSTDGTFVYTGFRPAYVMVKRTNSTNNWRMFDGKRDGFNADNKFLYANLSNAEEADGTTIDLISNGFKFRSTTTGSNGSGDTYIYIAFAETPFKYSNAR
jgi:hypothetical protein